MWLSSEQRGRSVSRECSVAVRIFLVTHLMESNTETSACKFYIRQKYSENPASLFFIILLKLQLHLLKNTTRFNTEYNAQFYSKSLLTERKSSDNILEHSLSCCPQKHRDSSLRITQKAVRFTEKFIAPKIVCATHFALKLFCKTFLCKINI